MGFQLPESGLPRNVAVGDTVVFEIRQTKDGMFQITTIAPTAEAPMQGMKDKAPASQGGAAK